MRRILGNVPGIPVVQNIAIVEGDTHIGKWVEDSGRLDHDQAALPIIGGLIKHGDVVYDIGAYIGDHTCYYASLKTSLVVAVEAQSDAFECLRFNTRLYPNIRCFYCALGAGELVKRERGKQLDNFGARKVFEHRDGDPTLTLDQLVNDVCAWPNLVKLDVEGWEKKILDGGAATLARHRPTLVLEVNRGALEAAGESPQSLYNTLRILGYRSMTDLHTRCAWEPGDPRPQFDVVCV